VKAAIYARVSTSKQDNDNQLIQLREFASKQDGWQIVAEYVDTVSGVAKLMSDLGKLFSDRILV